MKSLKKIPYKNLFKLTVLFAAAFFIGQIAGRVVDYMQPEAVPTAAEGSWGLSFQ